MPAENRVPDSLPLSPVEVFRSRAMGALTTITARTEMLARRIERSSDLDAAERDNILRSLRSIEAAAKDLVALVDGMDERFGSDGRRDVEPPR
jgi:hypothetical protein